MLNKRFSSLGLLLISVLAWGTPLAISAPPVSKKTTGPANKNDKTKVPDPPPIEQDAARAKLIAAMAPDRRYSGSYPGSDDKDISVTIRFMPIEEATGLVIMEIKNSSGTIFNRVYGRIQKEPNRGFVMGSRRSVIYPSQEAGQAAIERWQGQIDGLKKQNAGTLHTARIAKLEGDMKSYRGLLAETLEQRDTAFRKTFLEDEREITAGREQLLTNPEDIAQQYKASAPSGFAGGFSLLQDLKAEADKTKGTKKQLAEHVFYLDTTGRPALQKARTNEKNQPLPTAFITLTQIP